MGNYKHGSRTGGETEFTTMTATQADELRIKHHAAGDFCKSAKIVTQNKIMYIYKKNNKPNLYRQFHIWAAWLCRALFAQKQKSLVQIPVESACVPGACASFCRRFSFRVTGWWVILNLPLSVNNCSSLSLSEWTCELSYAPVPCTSRGVDSYVHCFELSMEVLCLVENRFFLDCFVLD